MTRLVPFLLSVSLAACSHGGAPDSTDGDEATPQPVTLTASGFRVEPVRDVPCRPVRIAGCAPSDGNGIDNIAVTCEDGSSVLVDGEHERRVPGRILLCADVDGKGLSDDLVVLSEGRLQAGRYSVPAIVDADVQATRIEHNTPNYGVILWGQDTRPQGWAPSQGSITSLSWAKGPCVGDGSKVACATESDPRVWRLVNPTWGAGDVVAVDVDFTPQTLIDVDLNGKLDLAGPSAKGLAWAGPDAHGAWTAVGPSVIGLKSGVLVAPTVSGGWGLHARSVAPLPGWGAPLGGQPLGTVIQVREAPRVLVVDPTTRHAWTIAAQPQPVP